MMQAFHNSPELKQEYVERMRDHIEKDELIRGTYWDKFAHKGCGVGCTVKEKVENGLIHHQLEIELDVPTTIFRLEDKLFENTPKSYYPTFPLKFLEAIPVGADCSLVPHRFLHWLLVDPPYGVIHYARESVQNAIQHVANLHLRVIEGGEVTKDEWHDINNILREVQDSEDFHTCRAARYACRFYDVFWLNDASTSMVDIIQGTLQEDPRWMDREDVRMLQAEYLLKLLREAPVA